MSCCSSCAMYRYLCQQRLPRGAQPYPGSCCCTTRGMIGLQMLSGTCPMFPLMFCFGVPNWVSVKERPNPNCTLLHPIAAVAAGAAVPAVPAVAAAVPAAVPLLHLVAAPPAFHTDSQRLAVCCLSVCLPSCRFDPATIWDFVTHVIDSYSDPMFKLPR
jgi:hypothetical protein